MPMALRMRSLFTLSTICLLGLNLGACSLVNNSLLSTTNAQISTDQLNSSKGIAFGDQPLQKLDVYQAKNATGNATSKAPVIVFFYGGSWQYGSRDQYLFAADSLVEAGYVVVLPDYRKYPEVKSPAFIEDAAAAVAWTKNNISRYGGNPQQIFIAGHSAGAHIAAMLATNNQYLSAAGSDQSQYCGFIGLSGPYDFDPNVTENIGKMFGPEARFPESQPVNYVNANAIPALLVHGGDDGTVKPYNSINLKKKYDEAGVAATLHITKGENHTDVLMGISSILRSWSSSRQLMINYITENVKTSRCQ